jgi:hypothetical protein
MKAKSKNILFFPLQCLFYILLNKMSKYFFFLNVILLYLFLKNQNQQREANKKYKPIKYNHVEKK